MTSTIYDVAKLAGVSTATVSRVINNLGNVRPTTEKKVNEAMALLNFTPNALAQSFASNKSFTIGFIMSLYEHSNDIDIDRNALSQYHTELFKGINAILEQKGYNLLILHSKNQLEHQIRLLMRQKKIDGLIIGQLPEDTPTFRSIIDEQLPVVYMGHIYQFNKGLHIYAQYNIYLNKVLAYLYDLGHRRVLFFCLRDPQVLLKEWSELNYDYTSKMDIRFERCPSEKKYVKERIDFHFTKSNIPTAVFSELLSDVQPILSSLGSLGFVVPNDVSLMSIEHVKDAGEAFYPRLTNIYVPVYQMGKSAVTLLLDYMDGTQVNYDYEAIIDSPLIERDSVTKYSEKK